MRRLPPLGWTVSLRVAHRAAFHERATPRWRWLCMFILGAHSRRRQEA